MQRCFRCNDALYASADPGSLWLATALGSSAAVSGSPHDSTPTASFDIRLVDLLWPQPPLTCSSESDPLYPPSETS